MKKALQIKLIVLFFALVANVRFVNAGIYFDEGDLSYGRTDYTEEGVVYVYSKIENDINYNGLIHARIPAMVTYNGVTYRVKGIHSDAFQNCSSLEDVEIADGVKKIELRAFKNCSNLKSITIPNSIDYIADYVFENCSNLISIDLPDSITAIGEYSFANCTNLHSVRIPTNVRDIERGTFKGCSSMTTIDFPSNLKRILNDAFKGCNGLTAIDIPDSVTYVGCHAFCNCANLQRVTIGKSVQRMSSQTLSSTYNLTFAPVFEDCNKLTTIIWNAENYTEVAKSSSYAPFKYTDSIKTIVFGENVKNIPAYLCYNMSELDSVLIRCKLDSVTIGSNAFYRCKTRYLGFYLTDSSKNIQSLFGGLINSAKEIELFPGSTCCGTPVGGNNHLPFMGNTSVEKITIPANIALIPDSTFMHCINLRDVTIGHMGISNAANSPHKISQDKIPTGDGGIEIINQTIVGDDIFDDCREVESIKFGDGVKVIGERACKDLLKLETVYFSESVALIKARAFENCISLKNVEIKGNKTEGGTVVEGNTFGGCSSLESITFGEGVKEVGPNICYELANLTYVRFPSTLKTIGQSAFYGCGLTSVTIPSSVTSLGMGAFANNPDLMTVDMKCSTTACESYGGYAQFNGCNAVTNVSVLMQANESKAPSLTEIFGRISIPNWRSLKFYEGSTIANIDGYEGGPVMPNLETLSLANSISVIGHYSFAGTEKLRHVTLPSSLKTIGRNVFMESGLEEISISEGVQEIPGEFCMGSKNLKKVTFGSQISNIKFRAFQDCKKLKQIHTKRVTPPSIEDYGFCYYDGVNKKNITVYVPEEAVMDYKDKESNLYWAEFYIYSKNDVQPVTLPSNTPQTEVQNTTASVSVPEIPSATYGAFNVTNRQDNSTREIEFTGWGAGFDFAPHRVLSHVNDEPGVQGVKFTMRELSPNTTYDYSITIYDIDENLLEEFTGTFTTGEEENPDEAIDQINQQPTVNRQKLIKDGQIFILRGDKTYTLTGAEVK